MPDDSTLESRLFDAFLAEARRRQKDQRPVTTLRLTWFEAWQLMSQLQLALRHPRNDGTGAELARQIVEGLMKACATTDELRTIAEMGSQAVADAANVPAWDEAEWLEATLP